MPIGLRVCMVRRLQEPWHAQHRHPLLGQVKNNSTVELSYSSTLYRYSTTIAPLHQQAGVKGGSRITKRLFYTVITALSQFLRAPGGVNTRPMRIEVLSDVYLLGGQVKSSTHSRSEHSINCSMIYCSIIIIVPFNTH